MTVDYVLLANHAEALPDGLVNVLGGGVRVYNVPVLPHTVSVFYLVARVLIAPGERGTVFPFSVQIHDPLGKLVPEAQIDGACAPGNSPYPELTDSLGLMLAFQGFTFSVAGLYKLSFHLGDLDPIELPILIHQRPAE